MLFGCTKAESNQNNESAAISESSQNNESVSIYESNQNDESAAISESTQNDESAGISESTQTNEIAEIPKSIITPIILGGEWFLNNQNESFLYYKYDYSDKSHPNKSQSLREMGALWSISKLAHFLNDERYEQLTQKGFAYFEETFKHDEENDFYYINITPHKLKLGYNAFAKYIAGKKNTVARMALPIP